MEEKLVQYAIFDKTLKYEGYKIFHIDIKIKGFNDMITIHPTFYTWEKALKEVLKILDRFQLKYEVFVYDEESTYKIFKNC